MNFSPQGSGQMGTTSTWQANWTGTATLPLINQTPWLYNPADGGHRPEILTDPVNGNTYYHMILGDFGSGFMQESFVQMGVSNSLGQTGYGNVSELANVASASGGTGQFDWNGARIILGNGYDPLDMNTTTRAQSVVSGNGTGNPTRVIMRQIVTDGEIMMEFLKDRYEYKPRVSQMLINPDMTLLFDIDMRDVKYDDMVTSSPVVNTLELTGENVPTSAALFDMSTNSQNSTVTGGKYTYTPPSSIDNPNAFGGAEGSYSYTSGGFDQTATSWKDLFDANAVNPWSFEEAKPAP